MYYFVWVWKFKYVYPTSTQREEERGSCRFSTRTVKKFGQSVRFIAFIKLTRKNKFNLWNVKKVLIDSYILDIFDTVRYVFDTLYILERVCFCKMCDISNILLLKEKQKIQRKSYNYKYM